MLGPVPLHSSDEIWLETRLSTAMELSFLDPNGGGHDLISQAIGESSDQAIECWMSGPIQVSSPY